MRKILLGEVLLGLGRGIGMGGEGRSGEECRRFSSMASARPFRQHQPPYSVSGLRAKTSFLQVRRFGCANLNIIFFLVAQTLLIRTGVRKLGCAKISINAKFEVCAF